MEENNVLQEGQVVETDYNKDLVDEYQRNYIVEEEGIGADPDAEPYDTQTKLNEVLRWARENKCPVLQK